MQGRLEEGKLNFLDEIRKNLAANLTAKGQTSTDDELLSALVAKVANISTGKKYATGTVTVAGDGTITVSGLSFNPGVIIAFKTGTISNQICYYSVMSTTTYFTPGGNALVSGSSGYVSSSAFKLYVPGSSSGDSMTYFVSES